MEEGEEGETRKQTNPKNKKVVIQIPSYQEVIESSQNPSQTFSQAFNFVRNTEFYSPPPPPPPPPAPTTNRTASTSASPQPPSSHPLNHSTQSGPPRPASVASTSSQAVQSRHAILVSHRQKGNPLLKHIRNVRWAFADVVCDYLLGQNSCALYLSLRYHLLHPDYLYYRIRELQKNYRLRVILCHVDVDDVVKPLLEVTKTALLHDCTLLCAWSLEECGRYLETIKMYENKPADLIQGQMDADYLSRLNHVLISVRHVNKTDVVTLGSTFGSLSHIMDASMEDLARCPGIGERKVKRLYDTFHEPFKRVVSSNTIVPDAPVPAGNEPSSNNEGAEADNEEDASKRQKKEPVVTVKSALSAAFAKHADKFGKSGNKSRETTKGDTDTGLESEKGPEGGECTSD